MQLVLEKFRNLIKVHQNEAMQTSRCFAFGKDYEITKNEADCHIFIERNGHS